MFSREWDVISRGWDTSSRGWNFSSSCGLGDAGCAADTGAPACSCLLGAASPPAAPSRFPCSPEGSSSPCGSGCRAGAGRWSTAVSPSPWAAGTGVPAAAAWAVPRVGLGCPSRAGTEPVTAVWAGVRPSCFPGGGAVPEVSTARGDTLDSPAPAFPALLSAGLVLCPVLAWEESSAGAGAGELADVPAWVTTARTSPEIVVVLWSSVENGICSGAGAGLCVVIKG